MVELAHDRSGCCPLGRSLPKEIDFREASAPLGSPYGGFKFGRMFSIFGWASAPVDLLTYRYGVGNACSASKSTIAWASAGAGPPYARVFDVELNFEHSFGHAARVRVIARGVDEKPQRINNGDPKWPRCWGAMGSAIVDVSGLATAGRRSVRTRLRPTIDAPRAIAAVGAWRNDGGRANCVLAAMLRGSHYPTVET